MPKISKWNVLKLEIFNRFKTVKLHDFCNNKMCTLFSILTHSFFSNLDNLQHICFLHNRE